MLSTPKYAGEPSVESLASGLATLGRYGDDYMVHAAHGETVIPKEILDSNPQLKRDLFRQMMMMGIRDPNRYVVGSSLNSINPVTGQPEFFFKKIFKAVKKVFKKALPIIATVAGNYIAPGIGGIIASALVTKLQGGSWGDALKSGAMAWAGQGIMGGLEGAMSNAPGATFFGGLQRGLTTPFTAAGNLFSSGAANPLSQGIFGSAKALAGKGLFGMPRYNPDATAIVDPSFGTAATPGSDSMAELGNAPTAGPYTPEAVASPSPIPAGGDVSAGGAGEIVQSDVSRLIVPPRPALSGNAAARRWLAVQGAELGDDFVYTQPTVNQPIVGPGEYSGVPDSMAELGNVPEAATNVPITDPSDIALGVGRLSDQSTVPLHKTDLGGLESFKRTLQQWSPGADYQHTLPDGSKIYGQDALLESRRVAVENATNLMAGKVKEGSDLWNQTIKDAMERGTSEATPSTLQKWGGIGGISALAYSVFSEDEEEFRNKNFDAASEEMTAYNEWKKIGDKNSPQAQALYFKWHGQPNQTRSQFEYLTGGPSGRPDWMFLPESMEGMYSPAAPGMGRNMGGEVIGPGTGTSDSIPARLSDGEFVMTADAVRNAGGGDRNLGAARMYDMMRRFEGGTA